VGVPDIPIPYKTLTVCGNISGSQSVRNPGDVIFSPTGCNSAIIKSGANIQYKSRQSFKFLPGFKVEKGASFKVTSYSNCND
jgi:hypothetical protein